MISARILIPMLVIECALLGTGLATLMAWGWALGRIRRREPLLAEGTPRIAPWGTVTTWVVIVLFVVVQGLVLVAYLALTGPWPKGRDLTAIDQMAVSCLFNFALLLVVPPVLGLAAGFVTSLRFLGIRREALGRHVREGAIAFLLLAPFVYAIQTGAALIWVPKEHPLQKMVLERPSVKIAGLAFVAAVILAPAGEELIFRGVLQTWLSGLFLRRALKRRRAIAREDDRADPFDETPAAIDPDGAINWYAPVPEPVAPEPKEAPALRWTRAIPIVLTSLLFALLHAPQWPAPVPIFVLSLGLGVLFESTGSLVASFTTHAMLNGTSTLILFLAMLIGQTPEGKKLLHPAKKAAPVASCAALAVPGRD